MFDLKDLSLMLTRFVVTANTSPGMSSSRRSIDSANTNWRTGTAGKIRSARCATLVSMRRVPQEANNMVEAYSLIL